MNGTHDITKMWSVNAVVACTPRAVHAHAGPRNPATTGRRIG